MSQLSIQDTSQASGVAQSILTIDLTPTWGEWGNVYSRLAHAGEAKAIRHLHPDFAHAMATCQAFNAIHDSLSESQLATATAVMASELAKQGIN